MGEVLEEISQVVSIAKDALSVIALLLGGFWTYRTFIHKRLRYPRAKTRLRISDYPLDGESIHLRVQCEIENTGEPLIRISNFYIRVHQVSPIPVSDGQVFEPKPDPEHYEIPWPFLEQYESKENVTFREIEPNESDVISFDFIVPNYLERIYLSMHIENRIKKNFFAFWKKDRCIGWEFSEIYQISSNYEPESESRRPARPTEVDT
ncbi:MAG: hypothetical protein AAGC93_28840 [Cyanobacteria bacterium P01_F01_bin.53]